MRNSRGWGEGANEIQKALENSRQLMGPGGGNGGDRKESQAPGQFTLPSLGLVLITLLYLSLVSFVKPSHKSCKVRLSSGYHHPSPLIDPSGRRLTIPRSAAGRLLLFHPEPSQPRAGAGQGPPGLSDKARAACCVCLLGVLSRRLLRRLPLGGIY